MNKQDKGKKLEPKEITGFDVARMLGMENLYIESELLNLEGGDIIYEEDCPEMVVDDDI